MICRLHGGRTKGRPSWSMCASQGGSAIPGLTISCPAEDARVSRPSRLRRTSRPSRGGPTETASAGRHGAGGLFKGASGPGLRPANLRVGTHARTHVCTHARTHARTCARTHARTLPARTHACESACTFGRTHARADTCTAGHSGTPSSRHHHSLTVTWPVQRGREVSQRGREVSSGLRLPEHHPSPARLFMTESAHSRTFQTPDSSPGPTSVSQQRTVGSPGPGMPSGCPCPWRRREVRRAQRSPGSSSRVWGGGTAECMIVLEGLGGVGSQIRIKLEIGVPPPLACACTAGSNTAQIG